MPLPRRIFMPLIVACGLFMESLDTTAIATALPAIAAGLGRDPTELKLALTAYLLSLAVFIPASGWLADRFGARNVFSVAITLFAIGSLSCGFAQSLAHLICSRILQGVGGAMMVPVARLIILRSVQKSELLNSMAWFTVPALFGPIIGAPLSGFITTYFSWRWIFWINAPIGVLGLILATRYIPDIRGETQSRLDLRGFALTAVGLCGVITGITALGFHGIEPTLAVLLLVFGAASLVAYVMVSRGHPNPFLDLDLFRISSFRHAVLGAALVRAGVGATPFLFPLMLQTGLGMSPLASGLTTFTSAIGAITMKFTARPILRRLGFRRTLIGNSLLIGALTALAALFSTTTPLALISGLLLASGFFRSLQFTSINALTFADVPPARMSRATSISSVTQQVAISLGITIGALAVELSRRAHGDASPTMSNFVIAFPLVGAITAVSALVFLRLRPDAGDDVSGRQLRQPKHRV